MTTRRMETVRVAATVPAHEHVPPSPLPLFVDCEHVEDLGTDRDAALTR